MAPTLSSNSFLLNTTPYSRLTPRNQRFTVLTKRAGPIPAFLFGKQAGGLSSEESQGDEKANFNPFLLNFGKAPDMKSLIPVVANRTSGLSFMNLRRKDPSTVFVAGATGQSGARIAQALLREGFTIRAGVADLGAAQELDQLVAQYKVR